MAAMLCCWTVSRAQAQNDTPPPPSVSRNENFSAKPAPALFSADCTGAGCHKAPQGLGKAHSQSSLAGFLREHYTNSRESAGALAAYILKQPAGPPPPEARAARANNPRQGGERSGSSWFDPEPSGPVEARPPGEIRTPGDARGKERQPQQQQGGRPSRSAARPADTKPADTKPAVAETRPAGEPASSEPSAATPAEPAAPPAPADRGRRTAEPAKPAPTPRNQRGRQQPTVAATPAPAEPAPAPAAPPPPQFDIFD